MTYTNIANDELSIYIHWPFCILKCPYCDFNSYEDNFQIKPTAWLKPYIENIKLFRDLIGYREVSTIFFGGGTPSLMDPSIASQIIELISKLFQMRDNVEITMEANPTNIEVEKFKFFKQVGINRVSLGIQSFSDTGLKILGRNHNSADSIRALDIVAEQFDNYSFDLIYGLPNQTIEDWGADLRRSLKYINNHISIYQLTIEEGTNFYKKYNIRDKDASWNLLREKMFHMTSNIITKSNKNMTQYEISNFSKPQKECRHNMNYWMYNNYIGIGPGAHSRISVNDRMLSINQESNPKKWLSLSNLGINSSSTVENISDIDIAKEMTIMGLRTIHGIQKNRAKFLLNKEIEIYFNQSIYNRYITKNVIHVDYKSISITKPFRILTDHIVQELFS